jgi:hypothetical protein
MIIKQLGMKLPSAIDAQLASAWDDVVLKALEQSPGARYRDATDMIAA